MPKIARTPTGAARSDARWFLNGMVVIMVALLLLAYLCFIQATVAFQDGPQTIGDFQRRMFDGTAKAFALVLASAVFGYFFTMQDYQMTFATLLERLMMQHPGVGPAGREDEAGRPGARSRSVDRLAYLESSVEHLLQENTDFHDRFDRQQGLMRDEFISRLLKGEEQLQWFQEQMRFMTCIRTEDYERAREIFEGLMASDYLAGADSPGTATYRMRSLATTLSNALGEVRQSVSPDFFGEIDWQDELAECASIDRLGSITADVFDKLAIHAHSMQKQSAFDKVDQIVAYLEEGYTDPNLSVGSLANLFDMNPSYLSRTFKKHVGVGLADYIANVRVAKAKELMQDRSVSVKAAAEAVGFNSVITMNRAFKRIEGTTAGRVRDI